MVGASDAFFLCLPPPRLLPSLIDRPVAVIFQVGLDNYFLYYLRHAQEFHYKY